MAVVTTLSDFGAQENKISKKKKKKISTVCTFLPFICHKLMGMNAIVLVSWMFNFKLAFSLSSFIFIKRLFNYSSLSAIWGVICISEVVDISFDNLDSRFWFIQLGVIWSVLIFFFLASVYWVASVLPLVYIWIMYQLTCLLAYLNWDFKEFNWEM